VAAGCNHTANYRGCIKWKDAKATLAKQAPERTRKSAATGQPAATKVQRARPSAGQMDLVEGWKHIVRGGGVVKATTTSPPNPNRSPYPVTVLPKQSKVTATRKTARHKKPKPKFPATTKPAAGKTKKKQPRVS